MTSKAIINKLNFVIKDKLLLALFLFAFVSRFYNIVDGFYFDYDQEVVANTAYNFFKLHGLSFIGQELSFQGFFLGPLHNWIGFFPYVACNLHPDCSPFFYGAISALTIIPFYCLIKKLIDKKTAVIACIIYSISASQINLERSTNSNFFLFISSIVLLYSLYKYFEVNEKYLILGAFVAGMATVNFNPVYIFSSLAFFATSIFKKRKNYIIFAIAIFTFMVNFFPLLLFNFRHNGIFLNSMVNFIKSNTQNAHSSNNPIFLLFHINLPFYANYLFANGDLVVQLSILILIMISSIYVIKSKKMHFLLFPATLMFTYIGLSFYKGHIPDYYFQQTLPFMIILISYIIAKIPVANYAIPIMLITINANLIINAKYPLNYQAKKKVVQYIITDSHKQNFNVYYNLPMGFNTGYNYLFKAYNRNPIDYSENLYIIYTATSDNESIPKAKITYPDKVIQQKKIDQINIISIK